jgi:hypothetical protein
LAKNNTMRYLFFLAFVGLFFCSFTDEPIKVTTKDVLTSVQKERSVVANLQTIDFLNKLNFNLPILKEIGLRYGTDDISNAKRQYASTFGFNSFKLIKEQKSIKNAQLDVYQAKKDMLVSQAIQERYVYMTDAYFSQTLLNYQRSLDTLLSQKNTVLKTSLKNGIAIKIKDLVETEDDIRSLKMASTEMDNIRVSSFQRIKEYLGLKGDFVLNFNDFVNIQKIEEAINSIKISRNLQSAEMKLNQSKVNLSQAELRVEEAAFKQIFNNFQLIYEHKNKTDFTIQDFSFRVGLNIPIKGNLRPKQNELLLDIKTAENDYQFAYFETDRQTKAQVLKIENLLKQYRLNSETLNNSLSNNLLNTPSVLATLAPSDIVDLKIIQQKKNIELYKTMYQLVHEYIKLLDITGDLALTPYKNYLSNSFEKW